MISAETQTISALLGWPALTALVNGQVYPDLAPQDIEVPLVVYERASSDPTYTIHGQLVATVVTVTVQCWAATRIAAEAIGDAAIDAMSAADCVSSERRATYDSDTALYVSLIDFAVWET